MPTANCMVYSSYYVDGDDSADEVNVDGRRVCRCCCGNDERMIMMMMMIDNDNGR